MNVHNGLDIAIIKIGIQNLFIRIFGLNALSYNIQISPPIRQAINENIGIAKTVSPPPQKLASNHHHLQGIPQENKVAHHKLK